MTAVHDEFVIVAPFFIKLAGFDKELAKGGEHGAMLAVGFAF